MTQRQLKTGYFALTGLNTIASSYYFNYLFFFLRDRFGFGNKENLCVTALHGLVYFFAAVQCGKFAARRGNILSLKIGFACLAVSMIASALLENVAGLFILVAGYTTVLLFTWPALESLVSEGETRSGVQRMVGIYNCTWASSAAFAYFTGGKLYDALGRGAIFWIPAAMFAGQFVLTLWLERQIPRLQTTDSGEVNNPVAESKLSPLPAHLDRINPKTFLKMAWLASPFAYIAINTLLAVMPGIADQLGLSPTRVGLFCSLWLFGRFIAFAVLWKWDGWHYRFRWLLGAFLLLIGSFLAILLARELWIVVAAQVFLGLATGLIYYSSLYYSMDVGEASSEHGGWHEAFIGVGIFAGPALGALALQLWPQNANAGTWAVTGLLLCGLVGLVVLRIRRTL
jgi:predicted MFS family arabinose efflux permease